MFIRKLLLTILFLAGALALDAAEPRTTINIDKSWRFLRGDAPAAWRADFDDTAWRLLDVPHDWGIEDDYAQDSPVKRGGGYLGGGIG